MKPFTPSGVLLISYSISKSSFTSSINSPHCHSYCSPVWRFVHPMLRPSERDSDGISFLSSRQSYQYRVQYDCLYFIQRSAGILSSILESPWATFATDSHWLEDTGLPRIWSVGNIYGVCNHFQRTLYLYRDIQLMAWFFKLKMERGRPMAVLFWLWGQIFNSRRIKYDISDR